MNNDPDTALSTLPLGADARDAGRSTSGNSSNNRTSTLGAVTRPLALRHVMAPAIITVDTDSGEIIDSVHTPNNGDTQHRLGAGVGIRLDIPDNGSLRGRRLRRALDVPKLSTKGRMSTSMPSPTLLPVSSADSSDKDTEGDDDVEPPALPPSSSVPLLTSSSFGKKRAGLRQVPSLTLLKDAEQQDSTAASASPKRPRNAKNLSLKVPMNRLYHSAPNSPPGTPGSAHPGLLSMMMARRDETLPEASYNDDSSDGLLSARRDPSSNPPRTADLSNNGMFPLSALCPRGPAAGKTAENGGGLSARPHTALPSDQRELSLAAHDPYRFGPVCIIPQLYLGTEVNAANREQLQKLGIRYILNVAKEVPVPYEDDMLLLSPRSERAAAALKATNGLRQEMAMPGLSAPTPPPRAYFAQPKMHPWHGVAAPSLLSIATSPRRTLHRSTTSINYGAQHESGRVTESDLLNEGRSSTGSSRSSNASGSSANDHSGQGTPSSEMSPGTGESAIVIGADRPPKLPNVGVDTWDRVVGRMPKERFRYKKFNWDHNQDDLLEFFENAFSFIDHGRSTGHGVLVHCQCGVSRSASLVLAYVMRNQRMPLHEAYSYVKERSPAISPNMSLFYQLVDFERKLGLGRRLSGDESDTIAQATAINASTSPKPATATSHSRSQSAPDTTLTGPAHDAMSTENTSASASSDPTADAVQLPRERRTSLWRTTSAHARSLSTVIEDIAEAQLSPVVSPRTPRTPCETCDEDMHSPTPDRISRHVLAK